MYFVEYIAKYIVTRCYSEGCPVSNTDLQSLVMKASKEISLVESPIETASIPYPQAYYPFIKFGDGPIKEEYNVFVPENIKSKLNTIIKEGVSHG